MKLIISKDPLGWYWKFTQIIAGEKVVLLDGRPCKTEQAAMNDCERMVTKMHDLMQAEIIKRMHTASNQVRIRALKRKISPAGKKKPNGRKP